MKIIVLIIVVLCEVSGITIDDIKSAFKHKLCIPGSVLSSDSESNEEKTEIYNPTVTINEGENNLIEKNALDKLNELAQFNEIKLYFELINEEGPAHSKIFTILLFLGDEKYESQASSLKLAKQKAATLALEQTQFKHPPIKIDNEIQALTPTTKLNNISAKLGLLVKYFLINENFIEEITSTVGIDERSKKSYLQKLNESIYNSNIKSNRVPQEDAALKGPFHVRVKVGEYAFKAMGYTIQSARHNAAIEAIKGLKKLSLEKKLVCMQEGMEKECKELKNTLKSPISRLNEEAQLRNLELEFILVEESGPSHKKLFKVQCKLGDVITAGAGKSKKEAKKKAAEEMVLKLNELPAVEDDVVIVNALKTKSKAKKKKKMLKNKMDKLKHVANDLFESAVNYASEIVDDTLNLKKDVEHPKRSPKKSDDSNSKSAKDELLDLSNALNFETSFNTFEDDGVFFSLLTLGINPNFICLGQDANEGLSKEKAARAGLKLLFNIGFSGNYKKLTEIFKSDQNDEDSNKFDEEPHILDVYYK